jgi:hypothetical protein
MEASMIIKHRKIGKYSGPVVTGFAPYSVPTGKRGKSCIYRTHWLTAKVETGAKFGAIMMADGTAVTAGLDQFALVYPKQVQKEDFNAVNDQGVLGKLLRRIELIDNSEFQQNAVSLLWQRFKHSNLYVAQDGVIRYLENCEYQLGNRKFVVSTGGTAHGAVLQDRLTPFQGSVPKIMWPVAKAWAEDFYRVFSDPATFRTQEEFGIERMIKNVRRRKLDSDLTAEHFFFGSTDITAATVAMIGPELDLAFAVWYSNSVNAPGTAMTVLRRCAGTDKFSADRLIRALATSKYGRWHWSIENGRYQRTRLAAKSSGLWPQGLFDGPTAIMPKSY